METGNSSSSKSVKSQLSPEEVRQLDQAKEKLFIQIYKKRGVYFKRWRTVAFRYFEAIKRADDNETIRYLDGMDKLVKPMDKSHRRALIKKEDEYYAKNQRLNPDTKIPQEDSAADDGTPSGNATMQAEDSSYEDEQVPPAADWKSEAGDSDTHSIFPMDE